MSDYILHLGDCLEEMGQIEDGSVDCIIADLPYGQTNCSWDVIIPFEPLWAHYKRVIKKRGAVVLFGSQPFTSLLVMSNLGWFRYEWVWLKNKHSNFLNAKIEPLKQHESIVIFCQGVPNYYPQKTERKDKERVKYGYKDNGKRDGYGRFSDEERFIEDKEMRLPPTYFEFSVERGLHPNQKPVALLEYLILTYTNPGELVLDNVFGSCSTGEAALRTGRRFVGIEKYEGYYQIGVERMERVAAELRGEYRPNPALGKIEDLPMFTEAVA